MGSKRQSMIKKSHNHLIIINYDYRRRIAITPEDKRRELYEEDPEMIRKMEPQSFSSWLRKNNLIPPDMDLPEYDEENIRKEYEEMEKNPLDKISDHMDDTTQFEICIINKKNEGLILDCHLAQGEIRFGHILNLKANALEIANLS